VRLRIILLILVGFFLYIPSLFGPFIWDDEDFVYANQHVKECRVDKFFSDSVTSGRGKPSNYYRPIQSTVYCLLTTVTGENPFWFHFVNVLVHIGAAITIFYFLVMLVGRHMGLPLLISIIFLIHPVQTEAVSYISGLSDPLYVLFGFLSLIFFLRHKTLSHSGQAKRDPESMKNYLLSLSFFSLSLLSKETGIVFLGIVFLYVMLNLFQHLLIKNTERSRNEFGTMRLIPYIFVAVIYLIFHFSQINTVNMKLVWGNSVYANSLLVRLSTFVSLIPTYISLLVFPKDLFMERDFGIKISENVFNLNGLFFVLINFLILFLIYKVKWKLGDKLGLLFFYFAFWISFLPYSGLVLINGIFYEHFLYLPTVWFFGFTIFFTILVMKQFNDEVINKMIKTVTCLFLIALLIRNLGRQLDWIDPIRFYQQTLSHAPQSVRIINGLAMAYADKQDFNNAEIYYKKAIEINPKIPNFYHNLANQYVSQGRLNMAEKYYKMALEIDPNFEFSKVSLINLKMVLDKPE
jgi:hypothetical protein